MTEPILFSLTIANARLKQVLKLHTVLTDPQIICGAKYPVICGTNDYPSTMEICRLTQLNEYHIAPELSEPDTYQAIRVDLEKLDHLLSKVGHTTLTRYKSRPSMLEVKQEVHRGQAARGFLEVTEIADLDRADLWSHVLLWQKRCAKGIPASQYKEICNQIIGLKLPADHLLTLTMKKDDLIVDCNNEYGTKSVMQVIKPERWMEASSGYCDDQALSVEQEGGSLGESGLHHTAAVNASNECVSIQIAWTHFVKYMQAAQISSEVRFYIRKEIPILMLEMMLHEGQARIEYGSVRFIIKEGTHGLPTIGTKVVKQPKIKKKAGRKRKVDTEENVEPLPRAIGC